MASIDGTASYSYDPTDQLIAANYSGATGSASAVPSPETYVYDANGNRITANGSNYTTGPANRLLSDGTYTYSYDAEGNRRFKFIDTDSDGTFDSGDSDITEFNWDNRNRLTEVEFFANYASFSGNSPTKIVDYIYDVENRWIGENIDSDGDGQIDHQTRFAYDGNQIVLQFDKDVSSATGSASALGVENLSHRYLWQANAVDQLLADEQLSHLPLGEGQGEGDRVYDLTQPGMVVWPLGDHLGTVRDLTVYDCGETSVVNHRVFDSFGNLKSQTNAAVDCLFGLTGRPESKVTGLRNHLNRWTDPKTADWMSEDPSGFTASDTNTHRYCGNRPIYATDPTGLRAVTIEIHYNFLKAKFSSGLIAEVNLILSGVFKGLKKDTVSIAWIKTTDSGDDYSKYGVERDKAGKIVKVKVRLLDTFKGAPGQSGGYASNICPPLIAQAVEDEKQRKGGRKYTIDYATAVVIAHEILYHCVGQATAHIHDTGFIDATNGGTTWGGFFQRGNKTNLEKIGCPMNKPKKRFFFFKVGRSTASSVCTIRMRYGWMFVIVLVIFAIYTGSYLVLSRAGFSRAKRDCINGFSYIEQISPRTIVLNREMIDLYYPLWYFDSWLGTGMPLASEPLLKLSGADSTDEHFRDANNKEERQK